MQPDLIEHAQSIITALWWAIGILTTLILAMLGMVAKLVWPMIDSRENITKQEFKKHQVKCAKEDAAFQRDIRKSLRTGNAVMLWSVRCLHTLGQLLYEICQQLPDIDKEHCEQARKLATQDPGMGLGEDRCV